MSSKKPVYEKPVIMPLGELARSEGPPPAQVPPPCKTGTAAILTCRQGGQASVGNCTNGTSASKCLSGAGGA